MLKTRLFLCLLFAAGYSCSKDNNSAAAKRGLNGRWNMTRVMDKSPGTMLTPPSGSEGKVFLEIDGDSFSGKTMRNTISNGVLTVNKRDSITFGNYSITQVAEDQWGGAFMTMLSSCMLQSFYPCRPSVVTWKTPKRIEINTSMRYVITLERF